jgi:uncharacterized Fe-S cluster-containing radical SAM superfamily protein
MPSKARCEGAQLEGVQNHEEARHDHRRRQGRWHGGVVTADRPVSKMSKSFVRRDGADKEKSSLSNATCL